MSKMHIKMENLFALALPASLSAGVASEVVLSEKFFLMFLLVCMFPNLSAGFASEARRKGKQLSTRSLDCFMANSLKL